jgi:hypothetical protein
MDTGRSRTSVRADISKKQASCMHDPYYLMLLLCTATRLTGHGQAEPPLPSGLPALPPTPASPSSSRDCELRVWLHTTRQHACGRLAPRCRIPDKHRTSTTVPQSVLALKHPNLPCPTASSLFQSFASSFSLQPRAKLYYQV